MENGAEQTFETLMERLEKVVELLEAGNLPLEKSMTLFEEGVQLSRLASGRLESAERKIEELLSDGSKAPFDVATEEIQS